MASGSTAISRRAAELRPSRLYVFMSDSSAAPPLPLAPPCTFEDHQDPPSGELTSHITRGNASAQTPSARGSRNKSFLLARRTSQI